MQAWPSPPRMKIAQSGIFVGIRGNLVMCDASIGHSLPYRHGKVCEEERDETKNVGYAERCTLASGCRTGHCGYPASEGGRAIYRRAPAGPICRSAQFHTGTGELGRFTVQQLALWPWECREQCPH